MGMIVIANPGSKGEVPAGGIVLWYGTIAQIPDGWSRYGGADNALIMGAASGQATTTKAGADTHTHTTPGTSTAPAHTHTIGGGATGPSGSKDHYATANQHCATAGHTHSKGTASSESGGEHAHTVSSTNAASSFPPYRKLLLIQAQDDAVIPIKAIAFWMGQIATIPSGWVLCDGNNGTPNMSARFVYGGVVDGDLGAVGGADTHAHANADAGAAGTHTHSLSVPITGGGSQKTASGYGGTSLCAGTHGHTLSATSGADPDHSHTIGATGSGSSLPQYVNLLFIMRSS